MSWAAMVAKNKDKEAHFDTPQQVVYATDPNLSEAQRKLGNVEHETVQVNLPSYDKGLLVLDANAVIKGMDNFVSIADAFVTTAQVIAEIRDRASRELMERLPHTVTVLDPSQDAITDVIACAEKTGDLGVLSRTDIRLCALALDSCKAAKCLNAPIEPRPAKINPSAGVRIMTEEVSSESEEEEEEEEEEQEEGTAHGQQPPPSTAQVGKNEDEDEGEWITPENIHEFDAGKRAKEGQPFDGGVACVTSDYAMQNVLLHLGVPIVGTNGMRIRELRLWLLRCTSCFTVVMDTTRQFCPECGAGDTLRRVSYVVSSTGEKQLFINFKKHISTRGTVYNLPKPRGGKRGTNRTLVLREDQLAQVIRGTSGTAMKTRQVAKMGGGDDDELAAFGEGPRRKRRNLAEPKAVSSYYKYNVNEKKKVRAAHKK